MTTWSMSRGEQQLGEGMSPLNKNGKTWGVLSDECQASLEDLETVEVEFFWVRFFFHSWWWQVERGMWRLYSYMDVEYGVQLFGKVAFFWSEKLQMTLRIVKFSLHWWRIHDDLNGYDEWLPFANKVVFPKKAEPHFFFVWYWPLNDWYSASNHIVKHMAHKAVSC